MPALAETDILAFLEKRFYQLSAEEPPPLLPGARAAFLRASAHCPVAIVTGSANIKDTAQRFKVLKEERARGQHAVPRDHAAQA